MILDVLRDINGKLSSSKIHNSLKNKDSTYYAIMNLTSFAHDSRTYNERIKFINNNLTEEQYCRGCGKLAKSNTKSFNTYCGMKCTKGLITHKTKQSDETKIKRKNTMIDKYGVTYNSQRKDIKHLLGNHFKNEYFIQDNIKKLKDISGINYELVNKDYIDNQLKAYPIDYLLEKLNCSHAFLIKWMNNNNMYLNDYTCSQPEMKIRSLFNNFDYDIKFNDRHLKKEIDIYLYNERFGIEVNGDYWHSYINPTTEEMNRHIDKYNLCKRNGIILYQFWEYEINNKFDIVKSIILRKLGHLKHADITHINEIDDCDEFIINNYIKDIYDYTYARVIYSNDIIIGVATFIIMNNKTIMNYIPHIEYDIPSCFDIVCDGINNIEYYIDKRFELLYGIGVNIGDTTIESTILTRGRLLFDCGCSKWKI